MEAVAKAVKAGDGAAEVDDDKEEGRQRIEPELCADPRQSQRQRDGGDAGTGQSAGGDDDHDG